MPKAKPIDWQQVERLASIFCTEADIAAVLQISVSHLQKSCTREHSVPVSQYLREKQGIGRANVRRLLWNKAASGEIKAIIKLAESVLPECKKQSSHDVRFQGQVTTADACDLSKLTDEELERLELMLVKASDET